MAVESSPKEALRRESAKTKEELAMQTSRLDDHIIPLPRQSKDAEEKLRELSAGSIFSFVHAADVPIPSRTMNPNITPTSLSTPIAVADTEPTQPSATADVATISLPAYSPINLSIAFECIDVIAASNKVIHQHHLHTRNTIISSPEPNGYNFAYISGETLLSVARWMHE